MRDACKSPIHQKFKSLTKVSRDTLEGYIQGYIAVAIHRFVRCL